MRWKCVLRRATQVCATVLVVASASSPILAENVSKLTVSVLPISPLSPLFVAHELGYFEREGIEIEPVSFISGAQAISALAAGHVDIAYSDIVAIALAVQAGFSLQIVAPGNVTPAEPPDVQGLVVRTDSPISTAGDLEGRSVAVHARNTISWLLVRAWIDQAGGDSSKVVFREVPFPQMNDALFSNQVDAAYTVSPFFGAGIDSGRLRLLGWVTVDVQKNIPIAHYVATERLIQQDPDLFERFARAYAQGVEWSMANWGTEEWAELIAAHTRLDTSVLMATPMLEFPSSVDLTAVGMTLSLMERYGLLDRSIDPASLVHETAR